MEHLLCAQPCAKHFTSINSFNFHHSPVRRVLLPHFTDEEIEIRSSYVICPSSGGALEASIEILSVDLCLPTLQEVSISLRAVTLPASSHSHVPNTQHKV